MEIRYYKEHSNWLNREMEFKVYGTGGTPCIFFPCQNGRFFDFENFGMLDQCWQQIEAGTFQLFTVDSLDAESLSAEGKHPGDRIWRQECYYHYIVDELVPRIYEINRERTGCRADGIMTMGFSMGAYHSANFYFRRPDLFTKNLSLSGLYRIGYMIENYTDEFTYANSPIDFLKNMPESHPYITLYRKNRCIIAMGQGDWEELMNESARELQTITIEKGIPVWYDYWGYDVCHDWCWWKKELEYFLPILLGE